LTSNYYHLLTLSRNPEGHKFEDNRYVERVWDPMADNTGHVLISTANRKAPPTVQ
jgi:hypothetical protein